jgi:stage III sporulation protein AG
MLEKKTAEVVKKITGTSGVTVAITLKNGTEYIYATELKEDSDTTEDIGGGEQIKTQMSGSSEERYIVIDDGNGGEKPLIISEISPQVKGAVIVCLKGLNELQKAQITESVSVLLNISEQNISVIGRS